MISESFFQRPGRNVFGLGRVPSMLTDRLGVGGRDVVMYNVFTVMTLKQKYISLYIILIVLD